MLKHKSKKEVEVTPTLGERWNPKNWTFLGSLSDILLKHITDKEVMPILGSVGGGGIRCWTEHKYRSGIEAYFATLCRPGLQSSLPVIIHCLMKVLPAIKCPELKIDIERKKRMSLFWSACLL